MKYFNKSFITLIACSSIISCNQKSEVPSSTTAVDIPTTPSEKQTLDNCWAYGSASWLEALLLRETGKSENVSEAYFEYKYFEKQFQENPNLWELQQGTRPHRPMMFMKDYGYILEKDFITDIQKTDKFSIEHIALLELELSMESGKLSQDRSPETIKAELDRAFGVNREQFISKVKRKIGEKKLADIIEEWNYVDWSDISINSTDIFRNGNLRESYVNDLHPEESEMMRNIIKAINQKEPIMLYWNVSFEAFDDKSGIFDYDYFGDKPMEFTGGHLTIIKDYTAVVNNENITEGISKGNSEKLKEAEEHGIVTSFIVKNSWGRDHGYKYNGQGGYLKLNANYLHSWLPKMLGPDKAIVGLFIPRKYTLGYEETQLVSPTDEVLE